MTRPAAMLMIAAPLLIAAQPAAPTAVVPYAPSRGGYQVQFPGRPKESSNMTKTDAGRVTVNTATFATDDGSVWLASHAEYPQKAFAGVTGSAFLAAARDGLKGTGGRVLDERKVRRFEAQQVAALDVTIDRGKNHVRSLLVLNGTRLFQVQVLGSKEFVSGRAADDFFDSFQLKK